MQIRAASGALGVEVRGIDLDTIDSTAIQTIRDLVHEHLVVFFPDQDLSLAGQRRFGLLLGDIVTNSYTPQVNDAVPGVTIHRSEDGYVADVWHSDGQPRRAPVQFTIFKMLTAPDRGGDTLWINQYRVYESLSAPLRDLLDGLTTVQQSLVNPHEQATHRAVIEHPVTRRKLLYVSKAHTKRFVELTLAESRAIIDYLVDFAMQPEFMCRYRWSAGAVGIWDNLATVHYGVNDFDEPRVFHRVMVQGPDLSPGNDRWAPAPDRTPRTMVRHDGTTGVVGEMNEPLWAHNT